MPERQTSQTALPENLPLRRGPDFLEDTDHAIVRLSLS